MNLKLPDPPLVAAGALGGPAVMMLVTPLRNALTVAASDTTLSAAQIYKQAFTKAPFAGGHYMAIAACPGFIILGPTFHLYKEMLGGSNLGACMLAGVSESMILYGSETKNAQMAFNSSVKNGGRTIPKLHTAYKPFGPGIGIHVSRNILAMSGLRVFSAPTQKVVNSVAPGMSTTNQQILSDLIANVVVSAVSTPIHQAYSYSATQRLVEQPKQGTSMQAITKFLRKQYLTESGRVSKVAARDMMLRVGYNATIFTLYGMIERLFVAKWPWRSQNGDDH